MNVAEKPVRDALIAFADATTSPAGAREWAAAAEAALLGIHPEAGARFVDVGLRMTALVGGLGALYSAVAIIGLLPIAGGGHLRPRAGTLPLPRGVPVASPNAISQCSSMLATSEGGGPLIAVWRASSALAALVAFDAAPPVCARLLPEALLGLLQSLDWARDRESGRYAGVSGGAGGGDLGGGSGALLPSSADVAAAVDALAAAVPWRILAGGLLAVASGRATSSFALDGAAPAASSSSGVRR